MDREIKFRFWDKTLRKMYYWNPSTEGGEFQLWSDYDWKVMQYTGLKDKNGTEIYEGDILKNTKGDIIFIIEFGWNTDHNAYGWIFTSLRNAKSYLIDNYYSKLEIIGNIWEHKNLLESNKIKHA